MRCQNKIRKSCMQATRAFSFTCKTMRHAHYTRSKIYFLPARRYRRLLIQVYFAPPPPAVPACLPACLHPWLKAPCVHDMRVGRFAASHGGKAPWRGEGAARMDPAQIGSIWPMPSRDAEIQCRPDQRIHAFRCMHRSIPHACIYACIYSERILHALSLGIIMQMFYMLYVCKKYNIRAQDNWRYTVMKSEDLWEIWILEHLNFEIVIMWLLKTSL
jgi:hypothetical protein